MDNDAELALPNMDMDMCSTIHEQRAMEVSTKARYSYSFFLSFLLHALYVFTTDNVAKNQEKTVNEFYKWIGKWIGERERERGERTMVCVFMYLLHSIKRTVENQREKEQKTKTKDNKTTQKRVYTKFSVHSVG